MFSSLAPTASAARVRFGAPLTATPTLDTANGAYSNTGVTKGSQNAIVPNPHEAQDLAVWNVPAGRATTAVDGQILSIRVKGCAIRDATAPSQLSVGTPVNLVVFQTLTRTGSTYTQTAVAGGPQTKPFLVPFCSRSRAPRRGAVNTDTVTSFTPLHLCVSAGQVLAFHSIGGFIPPAGGRGPWYPQGAPLMVIAPVRGVTMNSFVGVSATLGPGVWAPGGPNQALSGFGSEPGRQIQMQATEGTGRDAYGLCPGGKAVEPTNSNRVVAEFRPASATLTADTVF